MYIGGGERDHGTDALCFDRRWQEWYRLLHPFIHQWSSWSLAVRLQDYSGLLCRSCTKRVKYLSLKRSSSVVVQTTKRRMDPSAVHLSVNSSCILALSQKAMIHFMLTWHVSPRDHWFFCDCICARLHFFKQWFHWSIPPCTCTWHLICPQCRGWLCAAQRFLLGWHALMWVKSAAMTRTGNRPKVVS